MTRTAFDLFAGAGGASCGLVEAGFDVVAFEKWDVAADTHDANHDIPTERVDLETHSWRNYVTPDLLWASPPCQPWSAAGNQDGADDERDGMPWMLRAVRELHPPVVLVENVKGLTFEKNLEYLDGYVMAELRGMGYRAEWVVLDAADYGVPQNRERLIIQARNDGRPIRWPMPTHTQGDSLFLQPWVTMAQALGWDGPLTVNHWRGAGMIERHGEREPRDGTKSPSLTITAGVQRHLLLDTHRGQSDDGTTQTRDPHSAPAPALTAKAGGQWTLRTGTNSMKHSRDPADMVPYEKSMDLPALTVGSIRLTVEQAARLQDFPPGYRFTGTKTAQFTQIGNAVPRSLARALAACLVEEHTP
jgi:DNA (cytosine-5)-methyltransferase 1